MMVVRRNDDRSAKLAPIYAAFIQHGWNAEEQRFRNFMGYDRQWLESCGSEDSNGRTHGRWRLPATRSPSPGVSRLGAKAVRGSCSLRDELGALRAKAFAGLAGLELLQAESITTWPVGSWSSRQAS